MDWTVTTLPRPPRTDAEGQLAQVTSGTPTRESHESFQYTSG